MLAELDEQAEKEKQELEKMKLSQILRHQKIVEKGEIDY